MRGADFAAFWRAWPRKVAKGQAERAWAKAAKLAAPAVIVAAAEEFSATPKGQSGDTCPYPASWLNGKRWADDRADWWAHGTTPEEGRKLRERWVKARAARLTFDGWTPEEQREWTERHRRKLEERESWDPIRQHWEAVYRSGDVDDIAVGVVGFRASEEGRAA